MSFQFHLWVTSHGVCRSLSDALPSPSLSRRSSKLVGAGRQASFWWALFRCELGAVGCEFSVKESAVSCLNRVPLIETWRARLCTDWLMEMKQPEAPGNLAQCFCRSSGWVLNQSVLRVPVEQTTTNSESGLCDQFNYSESFVGIFIPFLWLLTFFHARYSFLIKSWQFWSGKELKIKLPFSLFYKLGRDYAKS